MVSHVTTSDLRQSIGLMFTGWGLLGSHASPMAPGQSLSHRHNGGLTVTLQDERIGGPSWISP